VLLQAVNGHISRGGEFEKRAAFIKVYDLPTGTVGLGHTTKGLLVWGHTTAPSGMPPEVQYQQLVHPGASATKLTAVHSYSLFEGKVYVSALFEDGDIYHYYDGVHVVDWDYASAKIQFRVTGGVNVTAKSAIIGFQILSGTNAPANKITGVFVDGVKITQNNIQHTGNNITTAAAVAAEITRFASSPNYTGFAHDNAVEVIASTVGTAANGKSVTVTVTGNVTTTPPPIIMVGGVNGKVSTIDLAVAGFDLMAPVKWKTSHTATAKAIADAINAFHGVRDYHAAWDGADGVSVIANTPGTWANGLALTPTLTNDFTIAITGTFAGGVDTTVDPDAPANLPYQPGEFVMTHGSKMYALSGSVMYFSMIEDPTKWKNPETNTGAGFIDMSQEASGSEELEALAKYQNYVAVFSRENIQIRYVDSDPALNKHSQTLSNTGTRSPHSVTQFGDNDIYYLDESGIRSLRARDSSNSASTTDVGVLVDPLVIEKLQTMTFSDRHDIFGLIEPVDGRFWLIMKDIIFVFSYFSGAKVSAWSTYTPSTPVVDEEGRESDINFPVEDAIVFRRRVYLRSGDDIYCYSGEGVVPVYDRTQAVMQTPYLDANAPAKEKSFNGWDAAVRGVWEVSASMDPNNMEAVDLLGIIDESTFPHNRMGMNGQSTHVSLRFKTRSALRAIVGNGLVHFTSDGEEDGTR
jgi:hypothetical protein